MICPKCGCENRDSAKFCDECGNRLDVDMEQNLRGAEELKSIVPDINENASEELDSSVPQVDYIEPDEAGEASFVMGDAITSAQTLPLEGINLETQKIPSPIDTSHEVDGFDFSPIDDTETAVIPTDGLHETVVASDYKQPQNMWGSGDTMQIPRVEGEEASKKKDFKAPDIDDKKKLSRGKKIALSVVLALVLIFGALTAAVFIDLPDGTNLADKIGLSNLFGGKKIPDVTGLDKAEAKTLLEENGFLVKTLTAKSDEKENSVLLMDPAAGKRMPEGETIVIHVATPRVVPEVVGKNWEEAEKALKDEGFNNVSVSKEKSNEAENTVLSITPEKGSKAKANAEITVVIAEAYSVPNVIGLDRAAAVQMLEAEGYQVQIVYVYTEDKENTVVTSDPAPGEKHNTGAIVTLSIAKSRGTELVEATQAHYQAGGSFTVSGSTYSIVSVDSVEFIGNETTRAVMTTRMSTSINGEILYGETKQRTFVITWDQNNNPTISV